MSVQFGQGVTVISSFWTAFLATVQAKSLSMQYNDDGTITTVFAFDGPSLAYQCVMWDNASGGTVPYAVIAGGYSQAQNNSDLSAFQGTYQSSCNQTVFNGVVTNAVAALNATVEIVVAGQESVGFQIAAGTFIGGLIPEVSFDNGTTWNQTYLSFVTTGVKQGAVAFGSANTATAGSIIVNGGAGLVRLRAYAYTSGTCNVTLRATGIVDPTLQLNTSQPILQAPPQVAVIGGANSQTTPATGVTRTLRVDRTGATRGSNDTMLAMDGIEGTGVNSWLWAQSTTTMTIAQANGVMTLNNGASVATTTDAIITTNRQFPLFDHGVLKFSMKAQLTQGALGSLAEFGFGAPSGTTATINNGAFFRFNGTGCYLVTSFNGTENVGAVTLSPSASEFYQFLIYVHDNFAHYVIEDSSGSPILDACAVIPNTVRGIASVTHLPAFARVYNAVAVGSAAKLAIGYYDTFLLDFETEKPWSHQLAATGRSANVNPLTFGQTAFLSASAAPATTTPTNTACAYATLGGEFVLNGTASSENLLGVFGFQSPSPYTLHVTDISLPQPFVTTALGATVNIQEWCLMVASSNNPSTATGQRQVIGMFSAAASATAGTVFNGLPIDMDLGTPIVVPPGQWLLLMVKVISGAASGVYRGSVNVGGYFE